MSKLLSGGVYLCGPIAGCTYEEARYGWRKTIADLLHQDIPVLSPMRQEGHLAEVSEAIGTFAFDNVAIATQRAIVAKDKLDIRQSSLVFANFLGAERVSIGSVAELGIASTQNKIIVVAMEPKGNIHDHVFVRELSDIRVASLSEAADVINALLIPGV